MLSANFVSKTLRKQNIKLYKIQILHTDVQTYLQDISLLLAKLLQN